MSDQAQPVINYFKRIIPVDDVDRVMIGNAFKLVHVKKRQFLVQPNFVATHRNFVVRGAFRSYIVAEGGHEHTIAFAIDDWWITDYNSYIFQRPSTMFVVALEDSIVLQIDFEKENMLKAAHHKYETFFRTIAERGLAFYLRRLISNLSHSAEERYREFEKNYPKVVQRVPQYALASYLGMTTEYLSKLRNQRMKKPDG
ncbi:MAG: Crp/Fnr family transcriptional regulator [Cyclobacteriaceae bacterium]|jgi:CRP-like cAMP-binding protein|nr:Crp/Fnr family transcriptional regulator [Cyclobacteriaceae bacterium]